MQPRIQLRIDRSINHPWIFRKMIQRPKSRMSPGTVVEVVSRTGSFVGKGFYHPTRTVAIRLLTSNPNEKIDEPFLRSRLLAAKALREEILKLPTRSNAYRLVHGEGDGLSGLVIDKYADLLVIEPSSAGYIPFADNLVFILRELYPGCTVCFRPDPKIEQQEGVSFQSLRKRYPCPERVILKENSLTMEVSLLTGHKTGYFLDQRDNRAFVAELSNGKEVWDLFCYTGGFGISAALGGAISVIGVDLDEKALKVAQRNADLNQVSIDFIHEDSFDFLRRMERMQKQADLVIVDPAKLALVREEIPRALRTYNDINRLAMGRVRSGGILVSCSCSGLVSEGQFLSVLSNAAREARVELQMFRITGASPDHPIRTDFPEGRYLKVVFSRVIRPS
ncbi:MAG: class I SAM-dependent rRNA methyltransferase [Spirochaetes bacterium]|nr:class I SAM-dependent rRNA methyltransferase [Spirochaetota bacterium]